MPTKESLPEQLRRPLVFGDVEQIAAVQELADYGDHRRYHVDVDATFRVEVIVSARSGVEARKLAEQQIAAMFPIGADQCEIECLAIPVSED